MLLIHKPIRHRYIKFNTQLPTKKLSKIVHQISTNFWQWWSLNNLRACRVSVGRTKYVVTMWIVAQRILWSVPQIVHSRDLVTEVCKRTHKHIHTYTHTHTIIKPTQKHTLAVAERHIEELGNSRGRSKFIHAVAF